MSRLAPFSTLSSYQDLVLPPIQLTDEPPPQSPAEDRRRTSPQIWKSGGYSKPNPIEPDGSAVLPFQNAPHVVTGSLLSTIGTVSSSASIAHALSSQNKLPDTSPRPDWNLGTLPSSARTISTPHYPLQANGAQPAAVYEDAGTLHFSPASKRGYVPKPSPVTASLTPALPTSATRSNEQKNESTSSSWHLTTASNVSGGTTQATTLPNSNFRSTVEQRAQHNLDSSELPLLATAQSEGVMQSQEPPGGPYVDVVTTTHDSPFFSTSAASPKQTPASNPSQITTVTMTDDSYDLPVNTVDTLTASRAAGEKRNRNAGASARFPQRRKDKENEMDEMNEMIKRLRQERDFYRDDEDNVISQTIKRLRQERDFYRDDNDRLRSVVLNTPGSKHHVVRSASFQPPLTQTAFQATSPTSERAPKRRYRKTRGSCTGTNNHPPTTTFTAVQVDFSPKSAFPSAKT